MAVNAQPWRYQPLPGNDGLLFVVDLAAWNATIGNRRCWVRFNRSIGGILTTRVKAYAGAITKPEFVRESTKAGVELMRPKWRWLPTGLPYSIDNRNCSDRARNIVMAVTNPLWTVPTILTAQVLAPVLGPELVVTAPFTWASVYRGVSGTLCY